MATVVMNDLILKAARKVQEYRTSAAIAGDLATFRFTSADWTDYINRAVREYLKEKMEQLGIEGFRMLYPEYEKESGILTVAAGAVAKPSDALVILNLEKSDATIFYDLLPKNRIAGVQTGRDTEIVPSVTKPVFWEEDGFIKTLGLTTGNVIARYIKTHTDVLPITSAAGDGVHSTIAGQYTAATQVLAITMNRSFTSGDENRRLMFYDTAAAKVYYARVKTVASVTSVVVESVDGSVLPAANIAAGNVTIALMEETANADIVLNKIWHDEIVERAFGYAMMDWEGSQLK